MTLNNNNNNKKKTHTHTKNTVGETTRRRNDRLPVTHFNLIPTDHIELLQ